MIDIEEIRNIGRHLTITSHSDSDSMSASIQKRDFIIIDSRNTNFNFFDNRHIRNDGLLLHVKATHCNDRSRFLTPFAKYAFSLIRQIPGIKKICCGSNLLRIYKSMIYSWDEIIIPIDNILKGDTAILYPQLNKEKILLQHHTPHFLRYNTIILNTRICLTKIDFLNIGGFIFNINDRQWNDFYFKKLTRKGKFIVNELKRRFNGDFKALKFTDYRIVYAPLLTSNGRRSSILFNHEFINTYKTILNDIG